MSDIAHPPSPSAASSPREVLSDHGHFDGGESVDSSLHHADSHDTLLDELVKDLELASRNGGPKPNPSTPSDAETTGRAPLRESQQRNSDRKTPSSSVSTLSLSKHARSVYTSDESAITGLTDATERISNTASKKIRDENVNRRPSRSTAAIDRLTATIEEEIMQSNSEEAVLVTDYDDSLHERHRISSMSDRVFDGEEVMEDLSVAAAIGHPPSMAQGHRNVNSSQMMKGLSSTERKKDSRLTLAEEQRGVKEKYVKRRFRGQTAAGGPGAVAIKPDAQEAARRTAYASKQLDENDFSEDKEASKVTAGKYSEHGIDGSTTQHATGSLDKSGMKGDRLSQAGPAVEIDESEEVQAISKSRSSHETELPGAVAVEGGRRPRTKFNNLRSGGSNDAAYAGVELTIASAGEGGVEAFDTEERNIADEVMIDAPTATDSDRDFAGNDGESRPQLQAPAGGASRPSVTHALSAELVMAEEVDEEQHRERIRIEAERDAEARLLAGAITTEGEVIKDDETADSGWNRKIGWALLCLLVIAAVVVSSLVATRPRGSTEPVGPIYNDVCENALGPLNVTGDIIKGTIEPRAGTDNVTCGAAVNQGGFGLWYLVKTTENTRLSASTCAGTDPNQDTQLLVLSGSCGSLECVGGSDQLCGSQAAVGWLAEAGISYYVLIRGFRASNIGSFTLTLEPLKDNSLCNEAVEVESNDISIFGSTRETKVDNTLADCGSATAGAPASWYRLLGDGGVKCASVSSEVDFFKTQLSIFSGSGCAMLTCVDGLGAPLPGNNAVSEEVAWIARNDTQYYLAVQGTDAVPMGDFLLDIRTPPGNDLCETAYSLPINGTTVHGTTINACTDNTFGCPNVGSGPGVWYVIRGLSGIWTASTCQTIGDFALSIFVFAGSNGCSKLECVDFTEKVCGEQTSATWIGTSGLSYYLFVQPFNPNLAGDFNITVEVMMPSVSDNCTGALTLKPNGEAVLGTTFNATTHIGCDGNLAFPGVYYKLNGTGSSIIASTCGPETLHPTNLTVMTGTCGRLTCVDASIVSCDGASFTANWRSVNGQVYYILVHGRSDSDPTMTGPFGLTVKEGELVPNDFCNTAQMLPFPSSLVRGSTVNATIDNAKSCGLASNVGAPGVWYTIVGTGKNTTASLCSGGTNYDTEIYIYSGNCSNLVCVAANDDSCNQQSSVTWKAVQGELYYILIGGFGNAVGNFELSIYGTSM